MDRLTGTPELLDGPLDDPVALDGNLRDLARLNRITGGTMLSARAIDALGTARTILDVGTGGADIPMTLLARARRHHERLEVTATDGRPEVLDAARRVRPAITRAVGLRLEVADGCALPYPSAAFDVVHASLVTHHLEPAEVVTFLGELRRVARSGIVVNDLTRGRLAWIGAWLAVHTLATGRYTRSDGPLSVRRAYTERELLDLVAAAGMTPVAVVRGFARHRVAVAAR
jgi:ubiquinone/menaquinone biosynthesis C-methylase UbiE